MFYLPQFPWYFYGTHHCSICFSYSNCFAKSLSPLPPTPVHSHSVLQHSMTLFILPLGEAEFKANWRFYLVERCTIQVESFHVNPGCSQKDQKLMCLIWYGVRLVFGHDTFLGVGFIGESSIWNKTMKKSYMLCTLQYAMFSNGTLPENY